jgi:drug/metabolite transporter (DMT)-like permease
VLAVGLALASSLAYGISDFLGGLQSRSAALLSVLVVSQTTALVLLSVIVISRGEGPPGAVFLLFAALAGLSEAVGVAALYRGLAVGAMGVVAPVGATAPVVPVAAGIALGEVPTPLQVGGIVLAIAGIALTSLGRASGEAARGVLASSLFFGVFSALGFGGFFAFMDAASEGDVPWALLVARLTAVTVFVGAMLLTRSPLAVRGARLPAIASIGVLIVVADSMYAISSTLGLLGVIAVLSSLYPLVTVALARVCLRERVGRLQLVGIAACLCGVVAISGPAGGGIAWTYPTGAEGQIGQASLKESGTLSLSPRFDLGWEEEHIDGSRIRTTNLRNADAAPTDARPLADASGFGR